MQERWHWTGLTGFGWRDAASTLPQLRPAFTPGTRRKTLFWTEMYRSLFWITTFIGIQMCVCVYVCMFLYTCVCTHVCPWRPEVNTECIPWSFSTLCFQTGFLTEPRVQFTKLARLAGQKLAPAYLPSLQPSSAAQHSPAQPSGYRCELLLHLLLTWALGIWTQILMSVQQVLCYN